MYFISMRINREKVFSNLSFDVNHSYNSRIMQIMSYLDDGFEENIDMLGRNTVEKMINSKSINQRI